MQFYNFTSLNFLWLTGGIILLFVYYIRKRRETLARLVDLHLLPQLVSRHNAQAFITKTLCFLAAFIFLVLALARPQWGQEQKTVQRKGVDVIFLLDTSLSMLTEDIKPSRIAKARLMIDSFVKKLKGDRVGLVLFAGTAFTATPLTLDYSAFRLFLDGSEVGIVPEQGTNFKDAIATAIQDFPKSEKQHKVLIILSDGEDHEGEVSAWIKQAKSEGVRIYTIGLGTAEGEPIPLRANKGKVSGYKKDKSGEIVISRLEDKVLKQMAEETGGKYYQASPAETEIGLIYQHMQSLGKREFQEKQITMREDHFQIFVILGLLFLLLEDLVRETAWRSSKARMAPLAALLFLWIFHSAFDLDPVAEKSKKAGDLYQKSKYAEALQTYRSEQVKHPENSELRYNVGTTLYKTKDFKEAEYQLNSALKDLRDPALKARAYYNHGNALYRLGDFEGAINAYQKALELNPQDMDAKYNLELLKKKKEAESDQHKEDKKDQKQEKQDQKQQDKNKQDQKNQKDQQNKQDKKDQDQKQQQNQKDQQNNQEQKDQNQQGQGSKQNQSNGQGSEQERRDQDQSQSDQNKEQQQKQQDQKQQDKNQQDQKNQQGKQDQENKQDQNSKQDQQDKSQADQNQKDQQNQQNQKDQQRSAQDQKDNGQPQDQKQGPQDKKNKGKGQGDQKDEQQKPEQAPGSEPDKSQTGQENKQEGSGKEKNEKSEGKDSGEAKSKEPGSDQEQQGEQEQKDQGQGDQKNKEQKPDQAAQDKSQEGKPEQDKSAQEKPAEEHLAPQEPQEPQEGNEKGGKEPGKEEQQPEPSPSAESKSAEQAAQDLKAQEAQEKEKNEEKGNEEGQSSEEQGQPLKPSANPVAGGFEPSQTPPPQLGQIALSPGESEGESGTQEGNGAQGAVAVGFREAPAKFQGEMSEGEALKILNALEGEEKQLLALRRPPRKPEKEREILKDW